MHKNIFILGDLMVDHTIFVADPGRHYQNAPGESVYKVNRRQNNAGGAANCARILSVLNKGTTYLWGIIGNTKYGNFRSILEASHGLDRAHKNIELRGVTDESGATMNTITRIVFENPNGHIQRKVRYDETDNIHISDEKRGSVLYHLMRCHQKTPLNSIIINDLDKGAINKKLVLDISTFAQENNIPIFIDPKREREKYESIQATAILPNLTEWCHLVNKQDDLRRFYEGLATESILEEMAYLSLKHLGNFDYHIITCDKKGSVLFFPDSSTKDKYAIYFPKAVHNGPLQIDSPMGTGDIVTALFAAGFDNHENQNFNEIKMMALNSFQYAHEVVAAYCCMPWNQMPSENDVKSKANHDTKWMDTPLRTISGALRFLPKGKIIELKLFKTAIPKIFSQNKKLCDEIERLVINLSRKPSEHCIIGAPSGFGKSIIIEQLPNLCPNSLIVETTGIKLSDIIDITYSDLNQIFEKEGHTKDKIIPGCIITVDEASPLFDNDDRRKKLLEFVNDASKRGIRFIFIDSRFYKNLETLEKDLSDIYSRCETYLFDGITDRPLDIPLLISSVIINSITTNENYIKVDGKIFLSATLQMLKEGNPRRTIDSLKAACKKMPRNENKLPSDYYPTNSSLYSTPNYVEDFYMVFR
jgi:sugar/nucleoside kinase (ribokinase family)